MAKKGVKLKGIEKVMQKLDKEVQAIEKRAIAGLIKSSIVVRRSTEKSSPKTPVDYGNLRASWFTSTTDGSISNVSPTFVGAEGAKVASSRQDSIAEAEANLIIRKNPSVIMGFGAYYAAFVHENMEGQFENRGGKKPGRPGSGAKFFETALRRNVSNILKILHDNIRIK